MGNLAVDYGQASVVSRNISSALIYLEEEIAKINGAISEIESLNRGYGKTSTILNELYDQKKKAQTTYDEMKQFSEKFNGFIKNVKTTDSEMAKKFTADVKTYCKKNNIEITSEFDAFLDKVQVVLDVVGVIPVFGDVADALNAVISLCRGNYLEALICLVAILPMGDLLKGLKFADKAKDILKLGDKALTATKTIAKEGAEKLSKQMTKLVKSGKIDNVIATMDAGKDFVVKFKNGSTALIKKGDLSEFVCQAFNKGCFMAGTLVTTKEGLEPIEEVKIGEYVLSRSEESGETSYKKVTDTLIRSTYNICTIELENGKIKSTTSHLFMVKDKWWKAAAELKAGDILETADGKCKVVKSITVEEKGYPVTTYNLSVEDNHTFFVGKLGVLTHNMKGFTPCELADEVAEKATKGVGKANKYSLSGEEHYESLKDLFGADNVKWETKGKKYDNAIFADDEKLVSHYWKHRKEFGAYSLDDYLNQAREVMNNGYEVNYPYKGEIRTGFLEYYGTSQKKGAKFAFVGTNNDGFITTFHTESGKTFWKMLNGQNIKVINPK